MFILKYKIKITALLVSIGVMMLCSFQVFKIKTPTYKINLKWYKGYEKESWSNVRTGMLWSFANLGAMLPKNSFDSALAFKDSTEFELDVSKLGFSSKALQAMQAICDSIISTQDYKKNNFIDLSRFLVLTLHSPYNYYQITEAETSYDAFKERHHFNIVKEFGVTNSSVSKGHRLIKFNNDTSILNMAFVAEEGEGSLLDSTFKTHTFEVITVMPNGHFKYAIYNLQGNLIDASPSEHSNAGKPSKCMWCHESTYSKLFTKNEEIKNALTNEQFVSKIVVTQVLLDNYRNTLNTDIIFKNKQDHTQLELLYISFIEPSLFRLKQEFKGNRSALNKVIKNQTHTYDEFPFLGDLYHRITIDSYFKYSKIKVPNFIREKSEIEPNYFN